VAARAREAWNAPEAKPSSVRVRLLPVKFLTEQTMRCALILIPSARSEGGGRIVGAKTRLPCGLRVSGLPEPLNEGNAFLASRVELSDFLTSIERRAYKQALFAVRDEEAALDIVQDAMMKLAEKYGGKPSGELPMLFQRILQNTIRDYYRRQKVRSLWTTLLSSLNPSRDDD
jgi:hypothetical protein